MNTNRWRTVWGVLLILGGLLLLAQTTGVLNINFSGVLWGILLGLTGLAFLSVVLRDRAQWWALIPGVILLSVSLLVILSTSFPWISDEVQGAIVPLGIGLAFLLVYLVARQNWWALIPAGVLFSVGAMIMLTEVLPENGYLGVFFLGLGLTFIALAMQPTPKGRMKWPWIPGGILAGVGTILLITSFDVFTFLLPLGLILFGGLLIWRNFAKKQADSKDQ